MSNTLIIELGPEVAETDYERLREQIEDPDFVSSYPSLYNTRIEVRRGPLIAVHSTDPLSIDARQIEYWLLDQVDALNSPNDPIPVNPP